MKLLCNVAYYLTSSNSSVYLSRANVLMSFFLKKNLYPGAQLKDVHLSYRSIVGNVFVPRTEAEIIPFASNNLFKILEHFSMVPGSEAAKQMENSLNTCEAPALKGEEKFCAVSLESMVDNIVSILGTHDIQAISTTINGPQRRKSVYNVVSPIRKFSKEDKLVICHPLSSPQATYYCHTNIAYKAYVVPLIGVDGSRVNALTVCHHDLVNFNSFILSVLKVKPGVDSICHFLPEDHILWIRNS